MKQIYLKILFIILIYVIPNFCFGQDEAINDSFQTRPAKVTLQARSDTIVKRVERWSKKKNIFARLAREILVFNHETTPQPEPTTPKSEQQYVPVQKKIIRRVDIEVLDPFGPNINNPYRKPKNWLEKSGNYAHYRTRNWIIRNKLLFKPGDSLDALKLSESERLIRSSSYITDARVTVSKYDIDKGGDSVDVMVTVQDLWGITAGGSIDLLKPFPLKGDLSGSDVNFLGLGHRFYNKFYFDNAYKNGWKYNGQYQVPEIGKTFISGQVFYNTDNRNDQYGLEFNRPFFSSTTQWAGGYSTRWGRDEYSVPIKDDQPPLTGKSLYNNHDFWVGHAFKPDDKTWAKRRRAQTIVSARTMITQYINRPKSDLKDLREQFLNKTMYLGSVGFSFRDYYKDNYIFGFGRTEDVPIGQLISITAGYERSEIYERYYGGLKGSVARQYSSFGYFYGSAEIGSFYNKTDWEESVISTQLLYFTEALPVNNWHIRQYLWNRFSLGYNRKPGQQLDIDKGNGLRGFGSDLRGTQKLTTNYEVDFFAPYKLFGFRTVGVIFADFGLIGTKEKSIFQSRIYQGYGLGLRLRNEHLIFSTAQISFVFYPQADILNKKQYDYYYTESTYYRFQDFGFSRPETAPF